MAIGYSDVYPKAGGKKKSGRKVTGGDIDSGGYQNNPQPVPVNPSVPNNPPPANTPGPNLDVVGAPNFNELFGDDWERYFGNLVNAPGGGFTGVGNPTGPVEGDMLYPPAGNSSVIPGFQNTNLTGAGVGTEQRSMAEAATGGSLRNFDRAANRVRDRIAVEGASQRASLRDQNIGSGFQGQLQAALRDSQAAQTGAYGDALVGLESEFEKSRLEGLNIAGNIMGQLGEQNLAADKNRLEQGLAQNQYGLDASRIVEDARQFNGQLNSENLRAIMAAMNQLRLGKGGIATDIINIIGGM